MHTIDFDLSATIAVSPATVWRYLVDWEGLHRWMSELSGLRITSTRREGEGVEGEASIRIGGISTTDRIRVTSWVPPQELKISHLGWVSGAGVMRCQQAPDGTAFTWRETLEPPLGPPGALGMRILKPLIRTTFEADVRRLKELVESGS
ncbi:MAG: SRPBCC family protein [Candidatus Dormibacteraeota bacterium]|nr:SRPBCC family protein [Candidatus Dormibacteraeota bacterium]